MPYEQNGRYLTISTILDQDPDEIKLSQAQGGGDPLLLFSLDGSEAVSQPYSYTVTLLRDHERHDLDDEVIKKLIHSPVEIGIRYDEHMGAEPMYFTRWGLVESFSRHGTVQKGFATNDFYAYKATIVPPFKLLEREVIFRIFEKRSIVWIIDAILHDVPYLKFNLDSLKRVENTFPVLEYCVQFGESTYDFLSRLMAYHGIWYMFGGDPQQKEPPRLCNDWMLLNAAADPNSGPLPGIYPALEMNLANDDPNFKTITDFVVTYLPTEEYLAVGNFNVLDPHDPARYKQKIGDPFNYIDPGYNGVEPAQATAFWQDTFPRSFLIKRDAKADAELAVEKLEGVVVTATGASKNERFLAGTQFMFEADDTDRHYIGKGHTYTLTMLSFSASELAYLHGLGADAANFASGAAKLISDVFERRDAADALAAAGLSNALQNAVQNQITGSISADSAALAQNANAGYFAAGAAGYFGLAAGNTVNFFSDLWQRYVSDGFHQYGNKFTALTSDAPFPPLPMATPKPRAHGPHLAVVIGKDGISDSSTKAGKTDIYADQFGRVRIRFPWDPGPPRHQADAAGPGFYPRTSDPWALDRNTCWVRVTQSWAGRNFGSQFLPRIGEEVIVDFIDGDPDRPIVTGRLYNANRGWANLPFPEAQVDEEIIEQSDLLNALGTSNYRFNGLRTFSTPKPTPDSKERYHLQRFDDTYDCEQYLLRSQGRLDVTALAHSFRTTYGNQHIKVAPGKDKNGQAFGGAAFTTIAGEHDLHVGDSKYQQVEKNYELTVKGNAQVDIKGDLTEIVKGQWSHGANEIVLEATQKITLKVGASWVVIDPCGVYINGPMVYINSGGAPGTRGTLQMQDIADAAAAEPGDEPNRRLTDCNPNPSGAGSRNTHTDQIRPAPSCEQLTGHVDCGDYGSSEAEALMSMEGGFSHDPNQGGSSQP